MTPATTKGPLHTIPAHPRANTMGRGRFPGVDAPDPRPLDAQAVPPAARSRDSSRPPTRLSGSSGSVSGPVPTPTPRAGGLPGSPAVTLEYRPPPALSRATWEAACVSSPLVGKLHPCPGCFAGTRAFCPDYRQQRRSLIGCRTRPHTLVAPTPPAARPLGTRRHRTGRTRRRPGRDG
jgi:hypothetical protein